MISCSFPIKTIEGQDCIEAFDRIWPAQNDISLHLNCWRERITKEQGGLGPLRHLFEAHNLIWPMYAATLHEWTIERFRAFDEGHKVISLAGCKNSAKSADAARFALLWWWANPEERAVIVASTTISALQKRIWAYLVDFKTKALGNMPGRIVNSPPPKMSFNKENPLAAIHGVALKEGGTDRTLSDLIGIHPNDGLLVVIDEASDVTPAINDAIANLNKNEGEESGGRSKFQMILLANSKSKLDVHGRLSEPKKGWDSIDPDYDTSWETKLGVCLYFDCYRSPAIHSPSKKKLQFLINDSDIRDLERQFGKDDPRFWRFARGFWPPDDIAKTVLSLSMIDKHRSKERAEFDGSWVVTLAGLDPAFTSDGDSCILRFATLGRLTNGLIGLDFGGAENVFALSLSAKEKNNPINYQIVAQTTAQCIARGVKPEHFGVDTWGFGTGAGDIFQKEWSNEINRIIGIGPASDEYVDSEMTNKAVDLYDRRATELWFNMRTFVQSSQIFGLDDATVEEFCSRLYSWKGKKISLESKREYKERMGFGDGPTGSPDNADAATIILEVAKRHGFTSGGREIGLEEKSDWQHQWEIYKGYRKPGQTEEEREMSWDTDPILGSGFFQED